MWVYLNSPDLDFLSVKWVVCYLHHRTEWNDVLSRPGTESWHRQPPSMVRADGGLAPPSALALGSHSQPPTQSAGKGHIGAALGGRRLLYELLAPSGSFLALSWEWLRTCAHTMSLASLLFPGRALRDWMPTCTLPSSVSKATLKTRLLGPMEAVTF